MCAYNWCQWWRWSIGGEVPAGQTDRGIQRNSHCQYSCSNVAIFLLTPPSPNWCLQSLWWVEERGGRWTKRSWHPEKEHSSFLFILSCNFFPLSWFLTSTFQLTLPFASFQLTKSHRYPSVFSRSIAFLNHFPEYKSSNWLLFFFRNESSEKKSMTRQHYLCNPIPLTSLFFWQQSPKDKPCWQSMLFPLLSFNPILPFLMLALDRTAVLVSHIDNCLQPLHFLPLPRKEGGVPDIQKDRVSENKHCCHPSILFRFCLAALSFSLSLLLRLNMCLRKNLAAGTESKQTWVHNKTIYDRVWVWWKCHLSWMCTVVL